MFSIKELQTHLEHIDELTNTIDNCESILDKMFGMSGERAHVISVIPPPLTVVSEPIYKTEAETAKAVALKIRITREQKGLRQQDLSDITGIARPNIARLESGRRIPKIGTLRKISEALGITINDLM